MKVEVLTFEQAKQWTWEVHLDNECVAYSKHYDTEEECIKGYRQLRVVAFRHKPRRFK
jgi:hypothetical protein